ncbi:MAG TPA: TonB-dependent receptor [Pyrinomonadaceae bacterium]|jgi:hypothetical protein
MKKVLITVLSLFLLGATVQAQSNTGRLVGTVSDPAGLVPGASIVVRDNQTGKERTVVADNDGTFNMPQLEPGTYTVKITAQGHKTFTANNVKIDVGRDYSLNATLEVGEISESVEVVAGADVLNATNGELSNTVSPRQIQELPLNGRDPTALIGLQAGTAQNGATNTTVNGQRSSFTNITRDGINIQDNYIRANASDFSVQRPTTDDVQEFTFTSQNAGAEQGYGASQVQFVTPRGQNDFHGAAWLYNRNSKFSANDFFNNASATPKPFLNRNQFGGKVSGPVYRNKLFFFGSYEGFRLRTQNVEQRTVLTPNARQGLFTYIRRDTGQPATINLFTAFGGATGITGINPVIQSRILANLPAGGNSTNLGDQRNTTGFIFNQRANFDYDVYLTRIDYDINAKNTVNGVYSFTDERVVDRPDVDTPNGFSTAPVVNQPSNRNFLSTAWRFTPTATLTNELRGGFFLSDPRFIRTTALPNFFITLPELAPGTPALINSPEVNFQDQGRISNTYVIQDNADYTRGNHSFRFGGQLQFFRIKADSSFFTIPDYILGTDTSAAALAANQFPGGISGADLTTANALLATLGGVITQSRQTFNVTSRTSGYVPQTPQVNDLSWQTYAFYVSDQWRVTPRFTLNLGVRYEVFTGLKERAGLAIEPTIAPGSNPVQALLNPNGTYQFVGGNVSGNKYFNDDKNNFAPVFSFAWSPQFKNKLLGSIFGEGRTVIRGGYRMSYVNDEFLRAADNALTGNAGLSTEADEFGLDRRINTPPAIPTPAFLTPPFSYAQANAIAGNFGTVFAVDPNLQVPRTEEYNFGIQRELGWQTALEVRYVGGRSNNLVRAFDFNQVRIRDNGFLTDFNNARFNLQTFGNANCNPATTPGCRALPFFNQIGPPDGVSPGGFDEFGVFNNFLTAGTPGQAAFFYLLFGFTNSNQLFLRNPNTGVADFLSNSSKYRYNALQVELRRRFAKGLYFQANYTFQKTLTDAGGVTQARFDPYLDTAQTNLEFARADYDQTQVFNFNGIYELPFGKGKTWMNSGEWNNRLFGGWQLTSIIRVSTGAPISIVDPRGTVNRAGRSTRNTANSSLSTDQIKDLIGVFRTRCGVFYINPVAVNINLADCSGTGTANPAYFTQARSGEVGNLPRAFINGPLYFNWDASIIKNIQLTERVRFQVRAEFFNIINRTNFLVFGPNDGTPQQFGATGIFNINSPTFGRLTTTSTGTLITPRVIQFAGRLEF